MLRIEEDEIMIAGFSDAGDIGRAPEAHDHSERHLAGEHPRFGGVGHHMLGPDYFAPKGVEENARGARPAFSPASIKG